MVSFVFQIRNGLGRFEIGSHHVMNALDAYAKLSKFTLDGSNQSASFSTRFVYSDSYTKSLAAGDMVPYLMLGPASPPFNLAQLLEMMSNGPDNMNVNVFNFGDDQTAEYVVMSDYWKVYEINPHNLTTVGPINAPIPGANRFQSMISLGTGHPLPEHGTTNHIAFVSLVSPVPDTKSVIKIIRIMSNKQREEIAEIEVDNISYMHSFGMTKNYVILFAQPLFIEPMQMIKTMNPINGFKWVDNESTMIYIINLKTGFIKTLKTENMFFLHAINAFEHGITEINLDLCTYQNGDALRMMDIPKLQNSTTRSWFKRPEIKRYNINIHTGIVEISTFNEQNSKQSIKIASALDFPTINENYRYEAYCYVYGVVYAANTSDFLDMSLVKKDLCTGEQDKLWHKHGSYFNEAWFVPKPGAVDEDDGVLLVDILDTTTKIASLVIFDAKTLKVTSSAALPVSNPFGTHGRFFANVA